MSSCFVVTLPSYHAERPLLLVRCCAVRKEKCPLRPEEHGTERPLQNRACCWHLSCTVQARAVLTDATGSGSATKIVDGPKHLIPFLFKPMSSQGADSHCVFALDFLSNLVYVVCIRYERFPEPRPTLRHRAQLPFPDYAALLGSMVPSRHSLGTFRHLRQGQLPLRSRGTA